MKIRGSTSSAPDSPVLAKRWTYPAAIPAFEHLALERTPTRSDDARPLASAELSRVSPTSSGWPSAHRVTTDDPVAALKSAGPIEALVVNLLDPEPDPALQLTWGIANIEKLGIAIDAICAEHAIPRAIVAAYVNAPTGWLDTLRAFAIARNVPTKLAEVPPRYPVAFAQLLRRQLRFKQRQRVVTLDAVALVEIGHQRLEGFRASLVPVAIRAEDVTNYHTVARGSRLSRVLAALHIDDEGRAIVVGPMLRGVRVDVDDERRSSEIELDAGELSFHVVPAPPPREPVGCIRCGWCAEVCPAALAPIELFDAALRRDDVALERGHVRACVDCGLCTAICPSQIGLHDAFAPRERLAPRVHPDRGGTS